MRGEDVRLLVFAWAGQQLLDIPGRCKDYIAEAKGVTQAHEDAMSRHLEERQELERPVPRGNCMFMTSTVGLGLGRVWIRVGLGLV